MGSFYQGTDYDTAYVYLTCATLAKDAAVFETHQRFI